jgi:hypothetical protein
LITIIYWLSSHNYSYACLQPWPGPPVHSAKQWVHSSNSLANGASGKTPFQPLLHLPQSRIQLPNTIDKKRWSGPYPVTSALFHAMKYLPGKGGVTEITVKLHLVKSQGIDDAVQSVGIQETPVPEYCIVHGPIRILPPGSFNGPSHQQGEWVVLQLGEGTESVKQLSLKYG